MSADSTRLRIATRESRLAVRQTEIVSAAIRLRHPAIAIEIVGMTTRGDRVLDRPLAQVGGKGLFVKELEVALDEGRADIAVHSLKDVPMQVPEQFALATFGAARGPASTRSSRTATPRSRRCPRAPWSAPRACGANASCAIAIRASSSGRCAAT